jgi:hypothetical protein
MARLWPPWARVAVKGSWGIALAHRYAGQKSRLHHKNFSALMDAWKKDYPAMKTMSLFRTRPRGGGRFGAQVREAQRHLGTKNDLWNRRPHHIRLGERQ